MIDTYEDWPNDALTSQMDDICPQPSWSRGCRNVCPLAVWDVAREWVFQVDLTALSEDALDEVTYLLGGIATATSALRGTTQKGALDAPRLWGCLQAWAAVTRAFVDEKARRHL